MKRAIKVAIVAAMLQNSAHATEKAAASDTAVHPEQGKVAAIRQAPGSAKKTKLVDKKTSRRNKAGKADPDAATKQDAATETRSDPIQQTVQLRGVRG